MGSMIHSRVESSLSARAPNSSPRTASAGRSRSRIVRNSASTARSASLTGVMSGLVSTTRSLARNRSMAIASAASANDKAKERSSMGRQSRARTLVLDSRGCQIREAASFARLPDSRGSCLGRREPLAFTSDQSARHGLRASHPQPRRPCRRGAPASCCSRGDRGCPSAIVGASTRPSHDDCWCRRCSGVVGESIQRKPACLTRRLSRSALRLRAGAPGHRDRVPRLVDYLLAVRARRAGKSNAAVVAAGSWRACGARQRGARVVHDPHRPLRLGVGVGGDHREHLAGSVRRALVATLALRPAAQDPS